MDPDATLALARAAVERSEETWDEEELDALRDVRDAFAALDRWITKGGYPPYDWGYRVPRTSGGQGPRD